MMTSSLEAPASQQTEELSTTIVQRVAAESDRDVLDLPPIHDAIDPTALDRLFAPTRQGHVRTGRVTFTYCGYQIDVESDGAIELEKLEETGSTDTASHTLSTRESDELRSTR